MAGRKKKDEGPPVPTSGSLFGERDLAPVENRPAIVLPRSTVETTHAPVSVLFPIAAQEEARATVAPAPAPAPAASAVPDEPTSRPRMRLILSPETPEEDVIIEPNGHGQFELSFLTHRGTSSRAVCVTRNQLEMLLNRGAAALTLEKEGA